MADQRCKTCRHFVDWGNRTDGSPYAANGVCTAPRPMIGQQPQREVYRESGKSCPMWTGGGNG